MQPLVAAALDTARRAGLCVTENDLMTPRKSVTALLGLRDVYKRQLLPRAAAFRAL